MMATERDPHGIVPPSFYEKWDSVRDAAMNAQPTTDKNERTRCPADECGSTNLRYRPGARGVASTPSHHGGTRYRCRKCGAEFDEPEGGE